MNFRPTVPKLQFNPRIIFAFLLLIISIASALVLTHRVGARAYYYQVKKELLAGTQFSIDNIQTVSLVKSGISPIYIQAGQPILGKTATHDLAPGELISSSAIGIIENQTFKVIELSTPKANFASDIKPGSRVDLYVIPNPNSPGTSSGGAKKVLSYAQIVDIDLQSANLGGEINFSLKISPADLSNFFNLLSGKNIEVISDEN